MRFFGLKGAVMPITLLVAMFLVVCIASPTAFAAKAGKVRVGTPDWLGPGVDGAFSLIAQIDASGNVSGEWQDSFTMDPGLHMRVTCLTIVGNTAWIGGVVTVSSDPSFVGRPVETKVVDGGLPNGGGDSITFTFIFPAGSTHTCAAQEPYIQFPAFQGNVDIK